MVSFEYDPNKSQSNKDKHAIDFETAQILWQDPYLITIPLNTSPEARYIAIGKINNKHWSAVYTYRFANIRIISVRRSRDKERDIYEYHRTPNT